MITLKNIVPGACLQCNYSESHILYQENQAQNFIMKHFFRNTGVQ